SRDAGAQGGHMPARKPPDVRPAQVPRVEYAPRETCDRPQEGADQSRDAGAQGGHMPARKPPDVRPAQVPRVDRCPREACDRPEEGADQSRNSVPQSGGTRAPEPDLERMSPPPMKSGEHAERDVSHPLRDAADGLLAPVTNRGEALVRVPTHLH